MPDFTIHVGMNARVYGDVTVTAPDLDAAMAQCTHEFVAANFELARPNFVDHDEPFGIALIDASWSDEDGDEQAEDCDGHEIRDDRNVTSQIALGLHECEAIVALIDAVGSVALPGVDADEIARIRKHLADYTGPLAESVPATVEAMADIVQRLVRMTTPEEEFEEMDKAERDEAEYQSPDDLVADMSDERLCGEYATFMDMVRRARTLKIEAKPDHREVLDEAAGALSACVEQIGQMEGMFDDEDGTIADAVEAAEDALESIRATR